MDVKGYEMSSLVFNFMISVLYFRLLIDFFIYSYYQFHGFEFVN